MTIDWILYRLFEIAKLKANEEGRVSYSQCGEDLIVRFVFDILHIPAPTYMDIGAHHPTHLNNTFSFYKQGSCGVNVEPDPGLIAELRRKRPRDINLNIGIGEKEGVLPFYVMSARTLNTFSEEDAHASEQEGRVRIEKVEMLPVRSVNAVLDEYCRGGLDFLSLDVEGLDLKILQGLDFTRFRPKVICVETITYSEHRAGKKIVEIIEVLQANDYFQFADTYVNTIFVDKRIW